MLDKVVGQGMVARAFVSSRPASTGAVIFASGVSNSNCNDPQQFRRERELLVSTLGEAASCRVFVYFGTCSVYDPAVRSSPYVMHKMQMEQIVLSNAAGLIVRLPQLIGPEAPETTLVQSLITKIRRNEELTVWSNATRNIIDIFDVVKIVDVLLEHDHIERRVINVANPKSILAVDLVRIILSVLRTDAMVQLIDKGSRYQIDTRDMLAAAAIAKVKFSEDYIADAIRKYYG